MIRRLRPSNGRCPQRAMPQPTPPPKLAFKPAVLLAISAPPEAKPTWILDTGMMVVSPATMGEPTTVLASTISRTFAMDALRTSETFLLMLCTFLFHFGQFALTELHFFDFREFFQGF